MHGQKYIKSKFMVTQFCEMSLFFFSMSAAPVPGLSRRMRGFCAIKLSARGNDKGNTLYYMSCCTIRTARNLNIISVWTLLPTHCSCRVLLLYLFTLSETLFRTPLDKGSAHRRDLYLYNTQHSQEKKIHAPGGIRTRNPSKPAATDWCLRLRGHPDLPNLKLLQQNVFLRRAT